MAVCYPTLIAFEVKTALEFYFVPVLIGKEHRNFLSTSSGALVISMTVISYAAVTAPSFHLLFRLIFAISLHMIEVYFHV